MTGRIIFIGIIFLFTTMLGGIYLLPGLADLWRANHEFDWPHGMMLLMVNGIVALNVARIVKR